MVMGVVFRYRLGSEAKKLEFKTFGVMSKPLDFFQAEFPMPFHVVFSILLA